MMAKLGAGKDLSGACFRHLFAGRMLGSALARYGVGVPVGR